MTVGAMRPDRSPALQQWLYDLGFLSFSGTMGVFLVGSLIWMTAILLDKNRVFPRWFAYLNLCNALDGGRDRPLLDLPPWGLRVERRDRVVDRRGRLRHVHGVFIYLLRSLILREDFGTGPLPDLPAQDRDVRASGRRRRRHDHDRRGPAGNGGRGGRAGSRRTRHVVLRLLRIADLHLVLLRLPVLPNPARAGLPRSPVAPVAVARRPRHDRPADQLAGDGPLRPAGAGRTPSGRERGSSASPPASASSSSRSSWWSGCGSSGWGTPSPRTTSSSTTSSSPACTRSIC